MYCPHCGKDVKATGPTPGGLVTCPACGKDFSDPNAPAPLPPANAARTGVGGVLLIVFGVLGCLLLVCGGGVVALLLPAISSAQAAADRMKCSNNLRMIGIAFHNYHSMHQAFPAQSVTDENGEPTHSWRVALLPFLEQEALYAQYDLDEPWDSPNNQRVADQVLPVYQCPASERTKGTNRTNYFVVYGDETAFAPDRWTRISDFTDGTSNTILVVECDTMDVPWAQPTDIPFDETRGFIRINPRNGEGGISSQHQGGANVLMGDGSVHFLSETMDLQTFHYLLLRNDGHAVSP